MSNKINPTSPEYQLSKKFPPDKETTWPFPAEKDGWVRAHNALRGEMQMMKEALEATSARGKPLREWEIKAMNVALESHLVHIHAHHSNEDDIFTPEMKKRFNYPDKLTTDHTGLVEMLESIEKNFQSLKPGDKVDAALLEWTKYQKFMIPHLQEEEDIGLPLFRAYFTPKDAAPIIMQIIKRSPKLETGALIYFCGEKNFRQEFMAQEGIPFFVWYIDFQFKHRLFINTFVKNLEALKWGEAPKSQSWWSYLFG